MKTIKIFGLLFVLALASCTQDFEEINKNPNAITSDEASARYFITNPQYNLYAPNRYPYWRAHLIHADRFSGQVCFGNNQIWWSDELGYSYHSAYTDATWDWLAGYFNGLDTYLKLTQEGGDFENKYMYAVGLIMKGLYFQLYTDVFGEIPYSEAGNPDVALPKFDTQKDIYQGIIADLDKAMATIGDATVTGEGVQDLGNNDLYCNGDLQKWKKLANSLKLRIALRAYGASGADFAQTAISQAITAGDFLETDADNVLVEKDETISQWISACYGDIWYCCGPDGGSGWRLSDVLIDYLRDYNDPRLEKYAQPVVGGEFVFTKPDGDDGDVFLKRARFIRDALIKGAGSDNVTYEEYGTDSVKIGVPAGYYIGQPVRLNGFIKSMVRNEFFCKPAEVVYQQKNQGKKPFPELVFTSAEAYFLRAEAAVRGISSENAQELFQNGIAAAMRLWGVDDAAIADYLANSDLADISTGTMDEKLEKIAVQRWIAAYTDGFEAWSDVRKSGYPKSLADGVDDIDIFGFGDINGEYPTRMRYGNSAYNKNGDNLQEAISRQGPDLLNTKLWWQK